MSTQLRSTAISTGVVQYAFHLLCQFPIKPCLLTKMILVDLTRSFLVAYVTITFLLAGVALVAEIFSNGFDHQLLYHIAPFLLPPTVPYALPIALLVSCAQTLGRLSATQELTAIVAGGVSPYLIAAPILVIAIAGGLILVSLHEWVLPKLNRQCVSVLASYVSQTIMQELSNGVTVAGDRSALLCEKVRDGYLIHPTMINYDAKKELSSVVRAETAMLELDYTDGLVVEFKNGRLEIVDGSYVYFAAIRFPIPQPDDDASDKYLRGKGSFASFVCPRNVETFSDLSRKSEQAAAELRQDPGSSWADSHRHTIAWALGKLQYYFARCAAPFAFIVLAGPLALYLGNGGGVQNFLSVSAPVMLGYFYGLEICRCVAERGLPIVAWFPAAVYAIAGLYCWRQTFYANSVYWKIKGRYIDTKANQYRFLGNIR